MTYAIVATNTGPNATIATDLSTTISTSLADVSVVGDPPFSCVVVGTLGVSRNCSLGSLPSGGSKTVTITGRAPTDGIYTYSFSIRAVESTTPDPNSMNNVQTGYTSVTAVGPPPSYHCSNGIDDDGDGKIDYPADPGCTSASDTSETDLPSNCHPSYPDFCIAPPPPDKNCDDFTQKNFRVDHNVAVPDPHNLDGNRNGLACES